MPSGSRRSNPGLRRQHGFTLLEVMIACAIFFMVAFAILGMVATGLAAARKLQIHEPDPGLLAAELSLTNQLTEGTEAGDFNETYPGIYRGCSWTREITEVSSNGLFQVDFYVYPPGGKGAEASKMSILMFRPGSPTRRMGLQPQ
jgi:Tfp pilus assembly protein PilV